MKNEKIVVEITSICEVINSDFGGANELALKRLFDIEGGILKKPEINPNAYNTFENRTILYKQDGPNRVGFIGCWHWTAKSNLNDPYKDYITSEYLPEIKPVIVSVFHEVNSEKKLKRALCSSFGINQNTWLLISESNNIFAYQQSSTKYMGVFFNGKELVPFKDSDRCIIRRDIISLNKVHIKSKDLIHYDSLIFYKNINVESSEKLVFRDRMLAVRSVVLKHTVWNNLKDLNFSRKDYRLVKTFLENVSGDVIDEIAMECDVSNEEAENYFFEFFDNIDKYMNGETLTNEVLKSMMNKDASLKEKMFSVAKNEWQKENNEYIEEVKQNNFALIESKKNELKVLEDTIKEKTLCEQNLQLEIEDKQEDLKSLQKQLEETKNNNARFMDDFCDAMTEKISNVSRDFGKLLADSVYSRVLNTGCSIGQNLNIQNINDIQPGLEFDHVTEFANALDAMNLIQLNLDCAGVNEKYFSLFSAYMLAALKNHLPVILAGLNNRAIADAVSVSLYSSTCAYFDCEGQYKPGFEDQIGRQKDNVICLDHFMNSNWVDYVPSIINACNEDQFIFLLTPYKEDLLLAPKGLYDYALPLLTNNIILDEAVNDWEPGLCINLEQVYQRLGDTSCEIPSVTGMRISYTLKSNIESIIINASSLLDGVRNSTAFLYTMLLIPFALVTGQFDRLKEVMENEDNLDSNWIEEINELLGE